MLVNSPRRNRRRASHGRLTHTRLSQLEMVGVKWRCQRGRKDSCTSEPNLVTRYDPFDGGLSLSLATMVGGLVYTSGMLGLDAELKIPGDVEEEFRLVFATLGGILEAMGTSTSTRYGDHQLLRRRL